MNKDRQHFNTGAGGYLFYYGYAFEGNQTDICGLNIYTGSN